MCHNAGRNMGLPPTTPPHFNGAFATHYYVSPGQFFYKVPDDVSDAAAAGANCGLAQMMFSLEKINVRQGQTVIIQGAGGLGLYAAAVANRRGATVVVVEKEQIRIASARQFGAHHIIDINELPTVEQRTARILELTHGVGADAIVEVTGRPVAFAEAIDYSRVGAKIASVGNLNVGKDFEIDFAPALITRKQVSIVGILRYDPWYLKDALTFLQENKDRFPFDDLSDRVFDMDDITLALELSESRVIARAAIIPKAVPNTRH
jgi:threonine dehydrogenase-like Zn-dependent dehydrogenase